MSQDDKLFAMIVCLALMVGILIVINLGQEKRLGALDDACGVEQVEG